MSRRPTESETTTLLRAPRLRTPEVETLRISRFAAQSEPRQTIGDVLDQDLDDETIADRYRLLELLGRGGMGEVNRAVDTKIGREVAVKTMRAHGQAPPGAATRFMREARVQALLEHPAIVPVYDIVYDEHAPYFAMKRVRGETLQDLFDGMRSLTQTRAGVARHRLLSAFVTVCLAVHYAHERGVVHRDLKPDNIMLGPHGEVYVLDWGVARILPSVTGELTEPDDGDTRPGEMVGTPGYMSPEQVLGQLEVVDAKSDIFALGAILYEILTLTPLIPGDGSMQVLEATLDSERAPPPPLLAPPELYVLSLQATKFHQQDRPASARELADGVERYLDGDRDDELRKRLADERATKAKSLATRALDGPEPERESCRAQAMKEAGRALGILPEHEGARAVVLRLLATPPQSRPAQVVREAERMRAAQVTASMKDSTLRAAMWVALLPLLVLMGARLQWLVAITFGMPVLIFALAAYMTRRRVTNSGARLGLFALMAAFGAVLSGVFGPLVFVPGFAAVNTVIFGAQSSRRHLPWVIALGCCAIAVPLGLELAGVISPSMSFTTDAVTLLPRMTWYSETVALVTLTLVSLIGVIAPTLIASRLRDALLQADERLLLHKWHMEQLAPARIVQEDRRT